MRVHALMRGLGGSALALVCSLASPLAACGDDGSSGDRSAGSRDSGTADAGGPGGGSLDLDACFEDLAVPQDRFVEVQSFATQDGAIRVRRARQPGMRSAVGETVAYDLVRFGIEIDGAAHCVTQAAQLDYEFGHHNWNERWQARVGAIRYAGHEELDVARLSSDFDAPDLWSDTIEAFAIEGDARIWGPRMLVPAGCYSLPYDYNPCFKRERTDQPSEGGQE